MSTERCETCNRSAGDNDKYESQLIELFEMVSGCHIDEFHADQLDFLADYIQGQAEADEACIETLKGERDTLLNFIESLQLDFNADCERSQIIEKIKGKQNER